MVGADKRKGKGIGKFLSSLIPNDKTSAGVSLALLLIRFLMCSDLDYRHLLEGNNDSCQK